MSILNETGKVLKDTGHCYADALCLLNSSLFLDTVISQDLAVSGSDLSSPIGLI